MTHIDPAAADRREDARHDNGQFGAQTHTAPELTLTVPTSPEETAYEVYADGALVSTGEKGAGMADALHRAVQHQSATRPTEGATRPAMTIRSAGSDVEVTVPDIEGGRIIGWYQGDAYTAEEMDDKGLSLTQFDSVSTEPYIDLGPAQEGDLPTVSDWVMNSDLGVGSVYARRDDDTGGRHIDVDVHENFLWNADVQCPDDEFDDDSDLDPDDERPASEQRYAAWLDRNSDIVSDVYREWFNAEIDAEDWESATVSIRKTVPYERFTESLVIEDIYGPLAQYRNRSDPGTFGEPYVMAEVRRRVEARDSQRELHAYKAELEQNTDMDPATVRAELRQVSAQIKKLENEGSR